MCRRSGVGKKLNKKFVGFSGCQCHKNMSQEICDRCQKAVPTLPCISTDIEDNRGGRLCVNCRRDLGKWVQVDPEFLKKAAPYPRGEGSRTDDLGLAVRIKAGLWPDGMKMF